MHYLPTPPADLAENLLAGWEAQAQPVRSSNYPADRAQLLRQLTPMCAVLVNHESDVNVDEEDIRMVLGHAASLGVGSTGSSGPGRAIRAAQQAAAVAQASHLGPAPNSPASMALLSIVSHPTAELEMDELTAITEYFQHTVGNHKMEVIFGHGLQADLPTELWVSILLAYGYQPPVLRPVSLLQPAPPATDARTGRDFYFEAAARLFVQRRRAHGSLLQRQFLIGYKRTGRLLDELVAAGIIAADPEGPGWRLLVADEAALNELLVGLDEILGDRVFGSVIDEILTFSKHKI